MKKSFSLMEVIITIVMLTVVMITLLQVKSDNIFLVSKSNEKSQQSDYIQLAINMNNEDKKNGNIFLKDVYKFKNNDIRKEVKSIKIKVKNTQIDSKDYNAEVVNFKIITNATIYSINDDIKKYIYTFKIKL
jgi:Tfp pilus assembly protein PilV